MDKDVLKCIPKGRVAGKRGMGSYHGRECPFSAGILCKSENECGKEKKGLSPHCCFSSKDDFHISHGKIRQRNSRSEYCMGRCEMRKSSVQFKDGKVYEGKWKVRAETGRDELKELNMKAQV